MQDFEVTATIGNEQKTVQVQQPFKTDNVYYVFIDRYLHAQLIRYSTGWKAFINEGSILTLEDGQLLCDMLEKTTKSEVLPMTRKKSFSVITGNNVRGVHLAGITPGFFI